MTDTDYHNHPAVSVHQLMRLLRAPALYAHDRTTPQQPSAAMRLGSLVHCAVLEPQAVAERYAAWDGPSIAKSSAISAAVRAHPSALAILESLDAIESPIFWRDPATAIACRSKPDGVRLAHRDAPLIVDLKTTQDASAKAFARSAVNFLYHMQAAAYIRAVDLHHGTQGTRFVIIAVETTPPHLVAVYELSPGLISAGVELLDRALRLYADCELTGNWPGYPDSVQTLDAPAWYSVDV